FDGPALTKKGQGRKALEMALYASVSGDLSSDIITIAAIGPIAAVALLLGPPELAAILFLALIVISATSSGVFVKGLLMLAAGLFLAMIGQDPIGALSRFSFGITEIEAGIPLLPMLIGVFALPEIFVNIEKKASQIINADDLKISGEPLRWHEFKACIRTIIRSTMIGTSIGLIPGVGQVVAAFMGYAAAKSASPTPEEFGKGKLEGVISSETANNAATGAAMIPLLALGLPGGALTAMMVGVFQMHDMEPGPLVFLNSPDLVWVVFSAMFFANLSILLVGYLETKTIINLLRIPFQFLAPLILLLATVGAYAVRGLVIDVLVMFIAGAAGFFLRRSGYSLAGIVLGLILGKIGEQTFAQAMQMLHFEWLGFLDRPVASVLIAAAFLTILSSIYSAFFKKHTQ
ncbi:MAG: hypothetical protein HN609_10295, partial [Proteobacteria bacterium]|nr:hypothetical protein [Pseudomonadota bacterium]